MERKSIVIDIPDGMCIDESNSTFEKIVFKKKDTKPRSWKEYLELNTGFDGSGIDWNCGGVQTTGLHHRGKAIVSTEYGAPFLAMMQLMSLRQAWIGDWEPNWDGTFHYFCIIILDNKYVVDKFHRYHQPLSFPTKEMAEDFMACFRDLLEIAKPLL